MINKTTKQNTTEVEGAPKKMNSATDRMDDVTTKPGTTEETETDDDLAAAAAAEEEMDEEDFDDDDENDDDDSKETGANATDKRSPEETDEQKDSRIN